MTDHSAAALVGASTAPAARLEPDAIGVAQDTVIGMASSAPAATIGLSIALLVTATAYGSGPILLITAIPMLIIANAYRRCNMWNANCGASFEWVGRAINPYLGFLTGWLMVVAYIIGTVAEILLLGPSVLTVFNSSSTSTWSYIGIGTGLAPRRAYVFYRLLDCSLVMHFAMRIGNISLTRMPCIPGRPVSGSQRSFSGSYQQRGKTIGALSETFSASKI